MHVQFWEVRHDCTVCEKCFYFLLNSSFSGKMVLQQLFSPPLPFEKEDRDYAFYMRDYKGETPLSPFSMTKFLFTELYSHNI